MRDLVEGVAKEVFERRGVEVEFKLGTMIELPRAASLADQLAQQAELFSCMPYVVTFTTNSRGSTDNSGSTCGADNSSSSWG